MFLLNPAILNFGYRCRVKMMEGPAPHNQIDAEVAAGMGVPDNGPKLRIGEGLAMAM